MKTLEVIFSIIQVLFYILAFGLLFSLKMSLDDVGKTAKYIANPDSFLDSEEDEVQAEIEKRNKEFNERIEKIKNELALETSKKTTEQRGEPALELHPLVHNLPHDSVSTEQREPDIEYAI